MRSGTSFLGFFLIVLLARCAQAENTTESKDCKFWHQLAYNLSHAGDQPGAGFIRLLCNSTCSSIMCSGHLNKISMPIQMDVDLDFCFGVRLNHCDDPVDMDYYLYVPARDINRTGSISHNDTYEFPAQGNRVAMVAVIEMVRVNGSYIMFGITGKVKLTLAGLEEFPYSEKVFPPTLIDVPPCLKRGQAKAPFNPPHTCVPPSPPATVIPAAGTTIINSKTYNGSCEFGLDQCGDYEMCRAVNSRAKNGLCVCNSNAYFDGTAGFCKPNSLTPVPAKSTVKLPVPSNTTVANNSSVTQANKNAKVGTISTVKPPVPSNTTVANNSSVTQVNKNAKVGTNSTVKPPVPSNTTVANNSSVTQANKNAKAGTNMTPVIIGAVFGGLLLIVVVVSVIIYIGRRRRQAILRGQHQLLMDNDDDDDDRNLVI